jgi:hypothetical protein
MIPWELVVLFSFAVVFPHDCSLDMTVDKVYICTRVQFQQLAVYSVFFFSGGYLSGDHHCTAVGTDMADVLAIAGLPKAILMSAYLYLRNNMVKVIQHILSLDICYFLFR